MLNKAFIEFLYEAAHIQRWNDHIRPGGFTELDKQAHKMMILYVLARYEEQDHGARINWKVLAEGGIMEFLHRIVLTDIKPPIFHELMRVHGHELNQWVFNELETLLNSVDPAFFKRMQKYFNEPDYYPLEKKLLSAAHYLATQWNLTSSTILTRASTAWKRHGPPLPTRLRTITIWPVCKNWRSTARPASSWTW